MGGYTAGPKELIDLLVNREVTVREEAPTTTNVNHAKKATTADKVRGKGRAGVEGAFTVHTSRSCDVNFFFRKAPCDRFRCASS